MPAALDIRFNYYSSDAVAGMIRTAFNAWTSRFDYTTGVYAINVTLGPMAGGVVPGSVGQGGTVYVQVGNSGGTQVLLPLFGLNVTGRNGAAPATPPLSFSINIGGTLGSLERGFEHLLGVQSLLGPDAGSAPGGGQTIYDGSVSSAPASSPTSTPNFTFIGPNAQAALGGPVPLFPFGASFVDPYLSQPIPTINLPPIGISGQASTIQPLDVAMLRDAGVPVLTDQELVEHGIARLYFAAYGRVATGTELTGSTRYYNAATAAGQTPAAILATIGAALASGSVFAGEYGQLSDADFVRVAYQNTFGRAVDGQLQAAITQYLTGSGTLGRGAVLASLTDTDEARGRLSANANVTYAGTVEAQTARLYDTAFGRAADPGGFTTYTGALVNGTTLKQVAMSFLQSAEFTSRYGASPSDQALVDGLYQNTLGRAPDAAGEALYMRALASGTFDRADLIVAFSESGEHIGLMAQRVGATDAAGMYVNTQTPLGLIPVLSGTTPFPGAVSG